MMKMRKIIILIALVLFLSSIMLIMRNVSFATEPDDEISPVDDSIIHMVDFGSAEWVIGTTKVTAAVSGMEHLDKGPVEISEKENIKLDGFNPETMIIKITAEDGFSTTLTIEGDSTKLENCPKGVALPSGTLTFVVEENPDKIKSEIDLDVKAIDTVCLGWINGVSFMNEATSFSGKVNGKTTTDKTNEFHFQEKFNEPPITEVEINDVRYTKGMNEVKINDTGFYVTVPGAESYIIKVIGDLSIQRPKTIIWTNPNYVPKDEKDAKWIQEFKLENGSAYVKEVYDKDGKLVNPKEYILENSATNGVSKDGFGWIGIYPGYRVVFEFIPEYGYQLTDIRINGQPLGIGKIVNEFEYTMPNSNIHFDAEFTKTENILKTESQKVVDGTILLGENVLDAGTAQLRIKDINLDTNKIKGFEEATKGYEIKNYLNIDLYQVFYKGKKDDQDVWTYKIDELKHEVEITLKLSDGINVKDVVLVHNIHNGEEYEIIEIVSYDEKENTITFRTKSFSNYAIATKVETITEQEIENKIENEIEPKNEENKNAAKGTKKEEKKNSIFVDEYSYDIDYSENPITGDDIAISTTIFVISAISIIIEFIIIKKNKLFK